jgi:glycosyltransferase involved in cell wall biosynthesis
MTIPISVVMCVYNRQDYVKEAINSILGQTFRDFEFIIVDDGSTDTSLNIALDYQKNDPRIRVHPCSQNTGIVSAHNTGLRLAQGKYIAWMDSDDISMPERLEKEFSFLQAFPEFGVVSSSGIVIDESGNVIRSLPVLQTDLLIKWSFCFGVSIINGSAMAKRELFNDAGGYRELSNKKGEYSSHDYDLWIRLSQSTLFYNLNEQLYKIRKHVKSTTRMQFNSTMKYNARICHRYIQSILGNRVSLQSVETLWGVAETPYFQDATKLINALYEHFLSLPKVSPQEKELIREDASWRMVRRIVANYWRNPGIIYPLVRAIQINPRLFLTFLRKLSNYGPELIKGWTS